MGAWAAFTTGLAGTAYCGSRRVCNRSSAGLSHRLRGSSECRGTIACKSETCWARAWSSTNSWRFLTWTDERNARSAIVHDCDLRAMRVRELKFDRHADRWNRRAGAESKIAAREIGHPRHARGNHGEPDVSFHRGDVPEMSLSRTTKPKPSQD